MSAGSSIELPPPAPTRFGRYTVLAPLAVGGMAQVHLAVRDGSDEICVLKRLLGSMLEHDTASIRFEREAHLAAQLTHPNVARVLDAGREGEVFYMTMEYIAGKDAEAMAHALMRGGRMLPFAVGMAIGLGVLDGLAYAHAAVDPAGRPMRIVHRDLSPRNMMVGFDGVVRIIDFGLARAQIDDFRTRPGMLMGTLRYVSPEQAMAAPGLDHRSDLYTLSVVLWELLTGRILVRDGEVTEILKQVVHDRPGLVHELNPSLPPALGPVIARGLEKRAEDRWPDAASYAAALRAAAPELTKTAPRSIGQFVASYFPEDYERVQAHLALVPRAESTRVEVGTQTVTGFVDLAQLGALGAGDDRPVVPSPLTPPDHSEVTRSAMLGAPRTELVRSRRAAEATAVVARGDATALVDRGDATALLGRSTRVEASPAPSRRARLPTVAATVAVVAAAGAVAVVIARREPPPVELPSAPVAPLTARPGAPAAVPVARGTPPSAAPSPSPSPPVPDRPTEPSHRATRPKPTAPRAAEPAATSPEAAPTPRPAADPLDALIDAARWGEADALIRTRLAALPPSASKSALAGKVDFAADVRTRDTYRGIARALRALEGER
jgi:hypothetical protein